MRRPDGVSIAAIFLALMVCFGLLVLALAIVGLFLTRNPIVPRIPTVRLFVTIFDALLLVILVWCGWTVVGLFQLKRWARYSILAIGALDFLSFGSLGVTIFSIHNRYDISLPTGPGPNAPHIAVSSALLAISGFYVLLALIGLWWLVYFNLKPVRLAFSGPLLDSPPTHRRFDTPKLRD